MASLEIFIELTNQIFWEGYAEQLAKENPTAFSMEVREFENLYNSKDDVLHHLFIGQSDHTNYAQDGARSYDRDTAKSDSRHYQYQKGKNQTVKI